MKTLDLHKLWEVCNTLSLKESELQEQSIFISFMGYKSNFCAQTFESFLEYYSFSIEGDDIIVFNDDGIPYESYNNDDFSYVPAVLLSFGEKELERWIDDEIEKQLTQQKREKEQQKENIKSQIERLKTQLNNL